MLQIIQIEPFIIGNVWYEDSWSLTADAIFNAWPEGSVGFIDCFGRMYTINNLTDLELTCETIRSSSDFAIRGV